MKDKVICQFCGIPISRKLIGKHIQRNRCKQQHKRNDENSVRGHKKTGFHNRDNFTNRNK